jgi:hypothetical protein
MSSANAHDSVFQRNRRLAAYILDGDVGENILDELLPTGCAHAYEKSLWDYKRELPCLPENRKPSDAEKNSFNVEMSRIVKDVVAFYNSHGGYLVVGVDDPTKTVVGFDKPFDCGELIKKVLGATKHEIDCHYKTHSLRINGADVRIGLLMIPRRPDSRDAAQFRRDAPPDASGKRAYTASQIYFRSSDCCKPAEASEDFTFLCSPERRTIAGSNENLRYTGLDHNLGPRDPGFIKFIGREEYLRELWRWLCDPFSPVKLLAGLGGVGKTTLAREFVEDVIATPPNGLEKVIWLSAKRQLFTASLGQYRPTSRVDFSDTSTLLRAMLAQLGYPDDSIDTDASQQDLIEEAIYALRMLPCLIVIDDVDSLSPEQQHDVFHSIIRIIDQTLGNGSKTRSRALLTARLDLGAAPGQLVRVRGLERPNFVEYVAMTAESLGIPWSHKPASQQMQRFFSITDGSPTFAASIIRLVSLGQTLDSALSKWKGADGEEVRRFAFERELKQLTDTQVRTLYAACLLGETSTVELQHVLQSSATLLNDDIGQLRKFHLVAIGSELPGGLRIELPTSIQLLADLMKKRIRDPKWLEKECEKVRDKGADPSSDVGRFAARVLALWKDGKPNDALELALVADKTLPDHPDIKCLVGRAYLNLASPDAQKADVAFHQASDLKCARPELLGLWLKAKARLNDWMGILEITKDHQLTPTIVLAKAHAYSALAEIALQTSNFRRASDHFLAGAQYVDESLQRAEIRSQREQIKQWKGMLYNSFVLALDRNPQQDDERLGVWRACLDVFRRGTIAGTSVISVGAKNLATWWSAVEHRDRHDPKAGRIMQQQLKALHSMIGDAVAEEYGDAAEETKSLQTVAFDLQRRCNQYMTAD